MIIIQIVKTLSPLQFFIKQTNLVLTVVLSEIQSSKNWLKYINMLLNIFNNILLIIS